MRGHRTVSHTADVVLEAWGPDLASCYEEAVAALVGTYAEHSGADAVETRMARLPPEPDESLLVDLLEEVIFVLDTADAVPVRAEVSQSDDGGLNVVFALVRRDRLRGTGTVPKAIARSELDVHRDANGVRCRFLVDV